MFLLSALVCFVIPSSIHRALLMTTLDIKKSSHPSLRCEEQTLVGGVSGKRKMENVFYLANQSKSLKLFQRHIAQWRFILQFYPSELRSTATQSSFLSVLMEKNRYFK